MARRARFGRAQPARCGGSAAAAVAGGQHVGEAHPARSVAGRAVRRSGRRRPASSTGLRSGTARRRGRAASSRAEQVRPALAVHLAEPALGAARQHAARVDAMPRRRRSRRRPRRARSPPVRRARRRAVTTMRPHRRLGEDRMRGSRSSRRGHDGERRCSRQPVAHAATPTASSVEPHRRRSPRPARCRHRPRSRRRAARSRSKTRLSAGGAEPAGAAVVGGRAVQAGDEVHPQPRAAAVGDRVRVEELVVAEGVARPASAIVAARVMALVSPCCGVRYAGSRKPRIASVIRTASTRLRHVVHRARCGRPAGCRRPRPRASPPAARRLGAVEGLADEVLVRHRHQRRAARARRSRRAGG